MPREIHSDERITPEQIQKMLQWLSRLPNTNDTTELRLRTMATHLIAEVEQLWSDAANGAGDETQP